MWANIAIAAVYSIAKLWPRPRLKLDDGYLLVMLVACGLSARQMFGDYSEAYTNVAVPAFPFLYILAVAFLYHAARWVFRTGGGGDARATGAAILTAILITGSYAGFRAATSSMGELRAGYRPLQTTAGKVYLNDKRSAAIYGYLASHTGPRDTIADIGGTSNYPGGLNFALQRISPMFSVLFTDIEPTDWILTDDLKRFRAAPPKFVIGTDPFQAQYGLLDAWNRCPFPLLVWAPHAANFDNNKRFPIIEGVRSTYEKVFQSGQWVVFAQKKPGAPSRHF